MHVDHSITLCIWTTLRKQCHQLDKTISILYIYFDLQTWNNFKKKVFWTSLQCSLVVGVHLGLLLVCSSFRWSKIINFGTNVCQSADFFNKFHVGFGTFCTAKEKKHVCNLSSIDAKMTHIKENRTSLVQSVLNLLCFIEVIVYYKSYMKNEEYYIWKLKCW